MGRAYLKTRLIMERIIIRRKQLEKELGYKIPVYDFLGDFKYGVWSCPSFRVYPEALLKLGGIVWLDIAVINEKMICWPYLQSPDKKSFSILKYKEHVKFDN